MARSISYGGWFLVALALHAGVFYASLRLIELRPEYALTPGASVELELVDAAPADEEAAAPEEPLPPPPEPPVEPKPESTPPEPMPEPEPEPAPAEDTPMAEPAPAIATPAPVRTATPRPIARKPAAPARAAEGPPASAARPSGPTGARTAARPNTLRNPPPVYPAASRAAREEGVTILHVLVTEEGRAASVRVRKSSGYPRLDEAAVSAVRRWRFTPARIGGVPVNSEVEVPVRFQLR